MMFHLKVSPNKVMSIPGNPKSTFGSPANANGRNNKSKYLSTVIKLLTITNRPPSRIHLEAPGCLSAKCCHEFLILSIICSPLSYILIFSFSQAFPVSSFHNSLLLLKFFSFSHLSKEHKPSRELKQQPEHKVPLRSSEPDSSAL